MCILEIHKYSFGGTFYAPWIKTLTLYKKYVTSLHTTLLHLLSGLLTRFTHQVFHFVNQQTVDLWQSLPIQLALHLQNYLWKKEIFGYLITAKDQKSC